MDMNRFVSAQAVAAPVAAAIVFLTLGSGSGWAQAPKQEEVSKRAAVTACEEKEIRSGKEKGKQERFYAAPVARVKEALLGALAGLEFEVKKDTGSKLEANKRRHLGVFVGSGGEKVVFDLKEAEESGVKGTRVMGETKKGFVGRAGQKSWTNALLDMTACLLARTST